MVITLEILEGKAMINTELFLAKQLIQGLLTVDRNKRMTVVEALVRIEF